MSIRVLGVLGGNDVEEERITAWCSSATHLYAADSGADRVISLGFSPVVVGDFDSFASLSESSHLRLEQSLDQNTTDCDKLLALAHKDGHHEITLTSVEGDLPDHVLATFSSAVSAQIKVRFAFRRGIGVVVRPGDAVEMKTVAGQRVSLVPLTVCLGASLKGCKWPLDGDTIEMGAMISVSNEAEGGSVIASVQSGAALLFCETDEIVW